MEKEFIPYEIALELKELGFDEHCFGYFYTEDKFFETKIKNSELEEECSISAPTFSQAFKWFREKYGYFIVPQVEIQINKINVHFLIIKFAENKVRTKKSNTYEEAELECLKKLIEIVTNKN